MDAYDYMMQSQRDPYKYAYLQEDRPPHKSVWKDGETPLPLSWQKNCAKGIVAYGCLVYRGARPKLKE